MIVRSRLNFRTVLLLRPLTGARTAAEKVNDSYLGRILRLTLIAPDITEATLAGRQPSTLQLDDLLKPLPAMWAKQRSTLRL